MRRFLTPVLVAALVCSPAAALGQTSAGSGSYSQVEMHFPIAAGVDQGGKLGVILDPQTYFRNDLPYVKIVDVLEGSSLYGVVKPGDFIYQVNGFDVRNASDVFTVVKSWRPGSQISIGYYDIAQHTHKTTFARIYGASLMTTNRTVAPQPVNPPPSPTTTTSAADDRPWCAQSTGQVVLCAGAVLGAAWLVSQMLGSGSGSEASHEGSGSSSPRSTYRPPQPEEHHRHDEHTDKGYGCYWGYQSKHTCH